MNNFRFAELCRELSIALEFKGTNLLEEFRVVDVNGVLISIYFDETVDPGNLMLQVDLGHIEADKRDTAYAELLHLNFAMAFSANCLYALDPETQHAVFAAKPPAPDDADGKRFAIILRSYAAHVASVRKALGIDNQAQSTESVPSVEIA